MSNEELVTFQLNGCEIQLLDEALLHYHRYLTKQLKKYQPMDVTHSYNRLRDNVDALYNKIILRME
jgi:hypothetical protein